MGTPHRKGQQISYWDENPPPVDYRDSEEFQEYREKVMAVLMEAKRPVTIREIHEQIGRELDKWTADVLETTMFILRIPGYVDHFAYEPQIAEASKTAPRRWTEGAVVPRSNKAWNGRAYV